MNNEAKQIPWHVKDPESYHLSACINSKQETHEQLREADAWIAEHVFDEQKTDVCPYCAEGYTGTEQDHYPCRNCNATGKVKPFVLATAYTRDGAASDALDDALLKKLPMGYHVTFSEGLFWMERPDQDSTESACHPDKKICRVLFAMKVFGK